MAVMVSTEEIFIVASLRVDLLKELSEIKKVVIEWDVSLPEVGLLEALEDYVKVCDKAVIITSLADLAVEVARALNQQWAEKLGA